VSASRSDARSWSSFKTDMKDYKCRDCGTERDASWDEVFWNMIKCFACGGICDPTEKTWRRRLAAKKVIGSKGAYTNRSCVI
jgi:hypothetical protein